MEIIDPAARSAIYEVNNSNSFDFYVAPAVAENDFAIPPPMDDFDNFNFFDGFEFDDDDDDDNNTASNKRSNSPSEYFGDAVARQEQQQEEAKILLGVYNQEERAKLLEAYREKRKRRVYGKVRYVLRQKVSENRPRVKGRFVTNNTPVKTEPLPPATEDERPRKRPSVISVFKNWTLSTTRLPAASPQSSSSCGSTPPAPPSKRSSLPPTAIPYSLHANNTSPRAGTSELWSERLMELRNKKRNNSTTAASTESHKAKREVPFVTIKPPTAQ